MALNNLCDDNDMNNYSNDKNNPLVRLKHKISIVDTGLRKQSNPLSQNTKS